MDCDQPIDVYQNLKIDQDDFVVKNLIDELLVKIENLHQQPIFRPRIRYLKKRNEDEIQISSDECELSSDSDESSESSDESLNEFKKWSNSSNLRSNQNEELNSDLELDDEELEKCLIRFKPLKTKGELLIDELPTPEDDLQLTLDINQLHQIGNVCKILDNLVVVESFKNLPALDLESILFFRTGLSIGRIFDVIGPVVKPYYVLRFATNQIIQSKSIFISMPIYFVPDFDQNLNITKYVLISQLKQTKGSDASWEHNNEPPENLKDYSDDEEELKDQQKLKAKRKQQRDNHQSNSTNSSYRGFKSSNRTNNKFVRK